MYLRPAAAAALAIVLVHQPLVWLVHRLALAPWQAFSLTLRPPFGIPAVATAVFWGAVWGPLLIRIGAGSTLRTALAGGLLTTLVGALLVWRGAAPPIEATPAWRAAVLSMAINGCWAAATCVLHHRLAMRAQARVEALANLE